MKIFNLFNRGDCPEGSSNPGIVRIMSIVACESNAIPVPPITAGSAKLPG